MVTTLEHNAAVRKQQQAQADNAAQSAAFWALRAGGKVEATAQNLSPISTQTFNTKQGVYVVEGKGKSEARIAAEKKTAKIQAEKQALQEKYDNMISTYSNSNNMPSYDAQSQKTITNNNVNPSSLYVSQPVNSNGNSQNSSVSGGVNVNANYNYATQMNDWQTANPLQSVNLGETSTQSYFTAGLSSVPNDNEVKTSLLGGDIQHQETDVSTNLTSRTNSSISPDPIRVLGGSAGILAGLAALLLLGRRK